MPTKKSKSKSKATPVARYKSLLAGKWSGDLRLGALLAEMFGTFVLTTIVLITGNQIINVIIAALAYLALVMALRGLSGGHMNPAVTLAMLATRKITVLRAGGYVAVQLLGAMLAMLVVTQFLATGPADPSTTVTPKIFEVQKLVGDWRPFFAEALGALVLGFGAAATIFNKKDGLDSGWLMGGSLLVGSLLATQASSAIINPAEALGVGAYQLGVSGAAAGGWVTVWVYALAPILGACAGAGLYKLMQWDVTGSKTA